MIDNSKGNMVLNVNFLGVDDHDTCESFIEELRGIMRKFEEQPAKESTIYALKSEIGWLLAKREYEGVMVDCDQFFIEEYWCLDRILREWRRHYPERFDDSKVRYTVMEVNNILFDLQTVGVVKGYECIAYPFECSDRIFEDRSVRVCVPMIDFR